MFLCSLRTHLNQLPHINSLVMFCCVGKKTVVQLVEHSLYKHLTYILWQKAQKKPCRSLVDSTGHTSVCNCAVTVFLRNSLSSSISAMITTFSTSTYKVGLKLNPNEQDHRVPVLSWSTCAYTIQSIGKKHTWGYYGLPACLMCERSHVMNLMRIRSYASAENQESTISVNKWSHHAACRRTHTCETRSCSRHTFSLQSVCWWTRRSRCLEVYLVDRYVLKIKKLENSTTTRVERVKLTCLCCRTTVWALWRGLLQPVGLQLQWKLFTHISSDFLQVNTQSTFS